MKKCDNLLEGFYEVHKKFGYLQSINLNRNLNEDGCSKYLLDMILCDYPFYEGSPQILLRFLEVRDFKLGSIEGLFKLLINITDISEHQMEEINYKVKEEENESFSFYCKTFEYKLMD